MIDKPTPGLFITGTDTGVGKTHVAAMIVRALVAAGHRVGVYKPAASGCRRDDSSGRLVSDDAVALWEAAGRRGELDRVCPQCFAAPLAPNQAARAEGRTVDVDLLRAGFDYWREQSDIVVVEGAGGLFSPLTDDMLNIDLAAALELPVVIVTANRLGTIHATLATLVAARSHSPALPIAGIVLNDVTPDDGDASRATNAEEIRRRIEVSILAKTRYGATHCDVDGSAIASNASTNDRRTKNAEQS
jgi:dethiobiotin synthetase